MAKHTHPMGVKPRFGPVNLNGIQSDIDPRPINLEEVKRKAYPQT